MKNVTPLRALRFIGKMMIIAMLASCQSEKKTAISDRKVEVLYASAPNPKHTTPPGPSKPPPTLNRPPESLAERCLHPLALVFSLAGRAVVLPLGMVFGAAVEGSTIDKVIKEPLP